MDTFTEPDPAERRAFNRLLYRNRRPTWFGHWVTFVGGRASACRRGPESPSKSATESSAGCGRGAHGGGTRYIVSIFGTISDWVHNLDAAHGEAVIAHGGTERVRLVLVPPNERAPILQEYVRVCRAARPTKSAYRRARCPRP